MQLQSELKGNITSHPSKLWSLDILYYIKKTHAAMNRDTLLFMYTVIL